MSDQQHRDYSNDAITVHWHPEKCIHSGNCVRGLPGVFDTKRRPWIDVNGADADRVQAQVERCPSGALSATRKGAEVAQTAQGPEVEVSANGPLLLKGTCLVKHADGRTETREKVTAFCRCGSSSNKPYCDGTHRKVDFCG